MYVHAERRHRSRQTFPIFFVYMCGVTSFTFAAVYPAFSDSARLWLAVTTVAVVAVAAAVHRITFDEDVTVCELARVLSDDDNVCALDVAYALDQAKAGNEKEAKETLLRLASRSVSASQR